MVAMVGLVGCAGATPEPPTGPDLLAQVEQLSRHAPALLACSVVSLPPVIGLIPGTGATGGPRQAFGPGRGARSLQRDMALQDLSSRASQQGFSPAHARELAALYDRESSGDVSERTISGSTDRLLLLREYAWMWALVVSGHEDAVDATRRIAEIEEADPDMEYRYAHALMYASEEWDFDCSEA